jgi:pimeloyl-ACP methyl ester carboxylesterase
MESPEATKSGAWHHAPDTPGAATPRPDTVAPLGRARERRRWWWLLPVAVLALLGAVLWTPDVPAADLEARWADGASRFVSVGGLRVHVRDEGQGQPIVLIHGTSSSLHTWDTWATALRDSFRVVRFDLPGFGLTGPALDGDYTMPAYARFIAAVMDSLRVGPAVVAGNSLGGEIAWYVAATQPTRVSRLVLVDAAGLPTGRGAPLPFRLANTPGLAPVLEMITPRSIVRRSLLEVYHDDAKVTDTLVDRVWLMARRPGARHAFVQRARALRVNDAERLGRIVAPTLVLWGAEDAWIPARLADEFARRIPGAESVVLPAVGHLPQEEAPATSLEALRAFLRRHP